MKTKLTLSVEKSLLPVARRCARQRGRSLSAMVEDYFRNMTREGEPTFSQKWSGRFRAANRNTPLYRALAKKYL